MNDDPRITELERQLERMERRCFATSAMWLVLGAVTGVLVTLDYLR